REPAGALRHVRASRALGLLRLLRPTPAASPDAAPSLHPPARRAHRGPPGGPPLSLRADLRVTCPAVPLRPHHGAAPDLRRGLPTVTPQTCPVPSRPATSTGPRVARPVMRGRARAAHPAHIRQV